MKSVMTFEKVNDYGAFWTFYTGSIPVRVTKTINPHICWICGFFLVLSGFVAVFAAKPQFRI